MFPVQSINKLVRAALSLTEEVHHRFARRLTRATRTGRPQRLSAGYGQGKKYVIVVLNTPESLAVGRAPFLNQQVTALSPVLRKNSFFHRCGAHAAMFSSSYS